MKIVVPDTRLSVMVRMLLAPAVIYLVLFCALTFPLILDFSTHLFADRGDGLQNYWNLWWIQKSVIQLHQPFWKTPYLHYPYGTSLLGHTLNPFNGLFAIPLLTFLTTLQAYNLIVTFSFVAGGVTAFLLAYQFTRAYKPSLIGGAIYTFSNYHFAHAQGHLQLVSLEWLPLFALLWYLLLENPKLVTGVAAGLVLFAVLLCDYYYFFYSVLLAGLFLLARAFQNGDPLFFARKRFLPSLVAFAGTVLLTSGPMVIALLALNAHDPLIGAHPTEDLSLDLLAPVIPGGHWRFASLTQGYWSSLPGNIHESSVHLGLSVLALLAYVWLRRRSIPSFRPHLWFAALTLFFVLSLGPVLHVWGRPIGWLPMPYGWLEAIFSPLALSGVPVRMMVMVVLASAVIAAAAFKMLFAGSGRHRLVAGLLLALLVFEYLPRPIPSSPMDVPGYVYVLKGLKDDKGVLDSAASPTLALYYQTIYEKPMALGYIARVPTSVATMDGQIQELLRVRNYAKLHQDFGIRYLVAEAGKGPRADEVPFTLLYDDGKVELFDFGP